MIQKDKILFEGLQNRIVSFYPRRFYLTGCMTNLYSFIRRSLESLLVSHFSLGELLWNQYKVIALNISSRKTLRSSCEILTIRVNSNI